MNKKMNKKMRMRLGAVLMAATLCIPSVPVLASVEMNSVPFTEEITPRGPAYEWVFKIVNGKMYKRLFNIKSGKYIGEWIPA